MLSRLNRFAFTGALVGAWSLLMALTLRHVALVYIWLFAWTIAGILFAAALIGALLFPRS